jgi:hypothetical protein
MSPKQRDDPSAAIAFFPWTGDVSETTSSISRESLLDLLVAENENVVAYPALDASCRSGSQGQRAAR